MRPGSLTVEYIDTPYRKSKDFSYLEGRKWVDRRQDKLAGNRNGDAARGIETGTESKRNRNGDGIETGTQLVLLFFTRPNHEVPVVPQEAPRENPRRMSIVRLNHHSL